MARAKANDEPARGPSFGEDVSFTLRNPSTRLLGFGGFLLALGIAVNLVPDKNDGRAGLMHVVGVLLALFGLWALARGIKLLGLKAGSAVVTGRELQLTRPGGATEATPLEEIERVMQTYYRGTRNSVTFELSGGGRVVLAAVHTTAEDALALAAVVMRRAELRRAGVRGREELAAAEAFLASAASGLRPFGVIVRKDRKSRLEVTLVTDRDELRGASRAGQLFVPKKVLAVLAGQDDAVADAKPLRGVSST